MTDKEAVEKIDDILCQPFDGDFTRINGKLRWRISLAERITIRERIIREAFAGYIKPGKPPEVLSDEEIDKIIPIAIKAWQDAVWEYNYGGNPSLKEPPDRKRYIEKSIRQAQYNDIMEKLGLPFRV